MLFAVIIVLLVASGAWYGATHLASVGTIPPSVYFVVALFAIAAAFGFWAHWANPDGIGDRRAVFKRFFLPTVFAVGAAFTFDWTVSCVGSGCSVAHPLHGCITLLNYLIVASVFLLTLGGGGASAIRNRRGAGWVLLAVAVLVGFVNLVDSYNANHPKPVVAPVATAPVIQRVTPSASEPVKVDTLTLRAGEEKTVFLPPRVHFFVERTSADTMFVTTSDERVFAVLPNECPRFGTTSTITIRLKQAGMVLVKMYRKGEQPVLIPENC